MTPTKKHGFVIALGQLNINTCMECGKGKLERIHRMDEEDERCGVTVDDDDGDAIARCVLRKGHEGKCGF